MRVRLLFTVTFLFFTCVLSPARALAQSTIAGLVSDTSGAVLPGVTVEAMSPVLIEKVRTAVSDGQGRYSIVDLRPGTYSVTFTLPGFGTVKHDGIEVAASVNVPINAELRVGAVEETVTVMGQTPVVDVQTVAKRQVVNREMLDALPTVRVAIQVADLVPGVKADVTRVGNSFEQAYASGHGLDSRKETVMLVDGLDVRTMQSNGQVNHYLNEALIQEVTYQTSAMSAESASGGLRVNMVGREGGNTFRGSVRAAGSAKSWTGDNITPAIAATGFTAGTKDGAAYDVNVSFGGPIVRDRLWFFGSVARRTIDQLPGDLFVDSSYDAARWWVPVAEGERAVTTTTLFNRSLRLTSQLSPRNKLTLSYDRPEKEQKTPGVLTSIWKLPEHSVHYGGLIKWTSPVTSRLLAEAGFASIKQNHFDPYNPSAAEERGTPAWYAGASRNDLTTGRFWRASADPSEGLYATRYAFTSAVSYVTGSHTFKTGLQVTNGYLRDTLDSNADLVQRYQNGVPTSVRVNNTPVEYRDSVKAEVGLYVQDAWTVQRATINVGLRFDHFNSQLDPTKVPPGRFTPFPREWPGLKNVPNWNDVSPRVGVAYDLFGNARTALKGSWGKYLETWGTGFADQFNPLSLKTETRNWSDCDYIAGTSTCSGRVLPTNGDDIAQDNEIGPGTSNFGIVTALPRQMDPDIRRSYNVETTAGIQHQLRPGFAVNVVWYHRGVNNISRIDNRSILLSDYTPLDIFNPIDGSVITIYNLAPAKLTAPTDELLTHDEDSDKRRIAYNGFEFSANGRLPRGGMVFGGWTTERTINVTCSSRTDPNTFRFCDQSTLTTPFLNEFKLALSQPVWGGVQVSTSMQSYAGTVVTGGTASSLAVNWNLSRTTRYPADCKAPCPAGALVVPTLTRSTLTVNLLEPGVKYLDRITQVNFGLRKALSIGENKRISLDLRVSNLFNTAAIVTVNQTYGSTLDRPTATLPPRAYSVEAQFSF